MGSFICVPKHLLSPDPMLPRDTNMNSLSLSGVGGVVDRCPGRIVTGNVSGTTCREHGEGASPPGARDTHKLLSSPSVPASHVRKRNSPDGIQNNLTLQGACVSPKPGHGF